MTSRQLTKMISAALVYASRQVAVFPVWGIEDGRCGCGARDCGNAGKHPIASLAPRGFLDATTDEKTILRWWTEHPNANIATPTDWCVVLDIDRRHGGEQTLAALEQQHGALPDTATVLTGGGGQHRYFARPAVAVRNSAGKIGPGIDVRGEGGYVLLPPSAHISGGTYLDDLMLPLFETPLAPMPAWLVTFASSAGPTNGQAPHRTSDEWGQKLIGATLGQRRAVALEITGHFLGLLGPAREAEVLSIMLGFAARCEPPFSERETRELVQDLARKDRAKLPRPVSPEPAHAPEPIAVTPHETERPADGPVVVRLADVAPEAVDWLWPAGWRAASSHSSSESRAAARRTS